MIYNFYVYQRNGKCLYYREWNRPNNPLSDNLVEDQRLVFGLIFSLQKLCLQLTPTPEVSNQEGFQSFRTARYTLNFFETPSGIIFAVNTDSPLQRTHLWHILSGDTYLRAAHVTNSRARGICELKEPAAVC